MEREKVTPAWPAWREVATWAWRLGVLGCLVWALVLLDEITRYMPSDVPSSREAMPKLDAIRETLDKMADTLHDIERRGR